MTLVQLTPAIMMLKPGEKIHVIHRQLYESDARRHFVGIVEACEGSLARVKGYLFATDIKSNQFVKRDSLRTRLIPLDAAEVIVNVLPEQVKVEEITYKYRGPGDTFRQ